MISHQLTLIKREIWEHPAVYVTPSAIALIVLLLTLTGQVSISAFGDAVDLGIVLAQNTSEAHRATALTGILFGVTFVFAVGALIIMTFYSLDALYAERKDKSILFWRSLPITDAESVVSKLLTALFVIPLVTLVIAIVTHLLILVLFSIWVMIQGGDATHLVWSAAPLADIWLTSLILAFAMPVWLAPFFGWYLLVSIFTKRAPFLSAFLPLLVLPMLEKMFVGTHFFSNAIFARSFAPPILNIDTIEWLEDGESARLQDTSIRLIDQIDLSAFLTSPSLWAGMVVCGLFVTAAVYIRRYRDESY